MIRILFVCHGNICRSPMAEFVLKDIVHEKNMSDQFFIRSAATSREELGSDIHSGTKRILRQMGIAYEKRKAVQLKHSDYAKYDWIIGMDHYNIANIMRIVGEDRDGKVHLLLDFTGLGCDVADPWYTGDFEQAYSDIKKGCDALFKYLGKKL